MELEKKNEDLILEENKKETLETNKKETLETNKKETLQTNKKETIQSNTQTLLEIIKKNRNNKNITVFNSIKENYLSWGAIFIAIYFISRNHFFKGVITFFLIFFLAYMIHVGSHFEVNFFTILHHYHHDHSNLFSHFIQCIMELGFPTVFIILKFLYGTIFLDEWIILFFVLFYTTIHNINYGRFRVNNVHSLHHKNYFTNLGPDFCDVIFGTKNPLNETVENTNHYIPNVIILTAIILCLQYFYLNETFKNIFDKFICIFLLSCSALYIICSAYVYYFYKKN